MKKERLLKVAEILEEVRPKLFNLYSWINIETKDGNMCSTSACAIGWAAQHPWFQSRGLRLAQKEDGEHMFPYLFGTEEEEFDAIRKFFGVSDVEATYLFDPIAYKKGNPSKKDVIDRINAFVKSGKIKKEACPEEFIDLYDIGV